MEELRGMSAKKFCLNPLDRTASGDVVSHLSRRNFMQDTGIAQAVEAAGSISALARQLGIAPQVAQRWTVAGFVPPHRAIEISELYPHIHRRDLVEPELLELYDAFAA